MKQYPFIFSDEKKFRMFRHAIFWLVWWVSMGFLYSFIAASSFSEYSKHLPVSLAEAYVYLPVHILLSYSLMYFVVPRYLLRQQYLLALGWVVVFFLGAAALSAVLSLTLIQSVRELFAATKPSGVVTDFRKSFHMAMMAGLRGGLTIAGIAAAIKLSKYWYIKEQRNMQLQKENAENQLQLLKAQVHPHFLFNTLNNIYAHTHQKAPEAAGMLADLSQLLRFILYEGNKAFVPLAAELKMVEEYVRLEKLRYGSRLDIQLQLPAETQGYYIAPLLLLPLVENSFKHGASDMLDQPWISLSAELCGAWLHVKIMNAKPATRKKDAESGIGLQNVMKRLELLYSRRHEITITEDEDIFVINLKLLLHQQQEAAFTPIQTASQHA